MKLKRLVNTYDLETIVIGEEGDSIALRIEVFTDGESFFARVLRRESYRLRPSFSLEAECDENVVVADYVAGFRVEKLRECSESLLLEKVMEIIRESYGLP